MRDDLLFYGRNLREFLEGHANRMLQIIAEYDDNKLLNTNTEDIVSYFVAEGHIEPITLRDSEIVADHKETHVDVSHRFDYVTRDNGPTLAPGAEVTLHVPFDGEVDLFRCQASTGTFNPPRGRVSAGILVLTFVGPQGDVANAKRELDSQLTSVRQYVTWTNEEVRQHNDRLPAIARKDVELRKQRLLQNQKLMASLGYPLKRRDDAPQTYAVPTVKKKVAVRPAPASTAAFVPEPALDDATYEQILSVLGNMVRVMEQSPGAFARLQEEDLRTHFLVQLNGQFEGKATGETFRGSGKTDILLVDNDKSVFIAECKFWKGPASLTGAIEQLLDYATWRDAKTAVLIFNRGAEFSKVVAAAVEALTTYPSRVGDLKKLGETVFRLLVRQRDDNSKLLTVTVTLYNVPAERTTSNRLKAGRKPRRGL